jgi:hypothetical protein
MKDLPRIRIVLRFASLLFGWLFALLVLCFNLSDLTTAPWRCTAWFASAVVIVILYSLTPNVFCKSSFSKRLALSLYCGVVVGFVVVSLWLISKLGTGLMLFGGTYKFGSSRTWGIVGALFMTLCALSGPVGLLLHKNK